ncbi:MAG: glycosyltransferase family 2 protein, partial [Pseudomonadota bacterium]
MDRLKAKLRDPLHRLQRGAQARWHARELTAVHDRTGAIRPDDVLLFACLRNEAVRVPAFLAHYRQLGVDHFLFVDNGSGDGFQALVKEQHDVSVWHTTASYRRANFGMHWLNALLRDHGPGHWCVTCDLDEFLIYPHHEHRKLAELGDFLQREGLGSMSGLMLDMYGSQPPHETDYRSGADPFEVTPWFDAEGYE